MIDPNHRRADMLVAKRVQISQPATLYFGNTTAPIHLLDLSLTGALALARTPPAEGTMISVACASEHVPARVVWTKGNRFGLAFALPLAPIQAKAMAGITVPARSARPAPRQRCATASLGAAVIKRELHA